MACSLWGGNSTRSKFNVDSDSGNVYYCRDGLCSRTGNGRGGWKRGSLSFDGWYSIGCLCCVSGANLLYCLCMCSFESWMMDGVLLCG